MLKRLILLPLLFVTAILVGQTEFKKKDWKTFNASFEENILSAEDFFSGKLNFDERDEINGMPTTTIPLYQSDRSFIENASYSSMHQYTFDTEEDAKTFFESMQENISLPEGYVLEQDEVSIFVSGESEPGMQSSAEISLSGESITFFFSPPYDKPIPMD